MHLLFFSSVAILGYIFIGYPVLVLVMSKILEKTVAKFPITPSVTMIIAAYNEEKIIEEKIINTLALDYPRNKLEILVMSDGSTDATDDITSRYQDQGITLVHISGRKGKTYCQNKAVEMAAGEIVVFSDANSMYQPDALRQLVKNFHDDGVGVVCGELHYTKEGDSQEGFYWSYEMILKRYESLTGSCIGVNGAIYAMRKNLYEPMPDHIGSDFIEPFFIYRKGFRIVYDPTALCTESNLSTRDEFTRKYRTLMPVFQGMYLIKDFLNPFKYGWYSIMLWSHKILRWFAFVFVALIFLTSLILVNDPFFAAVLVLQIIFAGCAFIGIFSKKKIFSLPYYFIIVYAASMVACWRFLAGERIIVWNTLR